MGLPPEILWSNSRSYPLAPAAGHSAKAPLSLSEGVAASNRRWLLTTFRGGTLTLALFQFTYILQIIYLVNIPAFSAMPPAVLGIDWLIAILPCLAFAFSFTSWFVLHWRGVTLGLCIALAGLAASVNVMLHESVPMFIEALLALVGTGALVPWSEPWQAALSAFCLAGFAVVQTLAPVANSYTYFRWLGMMGAVLVAQIAVHLTSLYRRGLAERYEELAQSERRAAASEAKLRKIFESTSDAIVIFSLLDGRTIEVNSEFTRVTGYTREEALAARHGKVPLWGNKEQGRSFLRELGAKGILRNIEVQVRNRNGTLAPFLLSGSTVELD